MEDCSKCTELKAQLEKNEKTLQIVEDKLIDRVETAILKRINSGLVDGNLVHEFAKREVENQELRETIFELKGISKSQKLMIRAQDKCIDDFKDDIDRIEDNMTVALILMT